MAKWQGADYVISGVWKSGNTITHYAMHTCNDNGNVGIAVKRTKAEAVSLVNGAGKVMTLMWNYKTGAFTSGEKVEVVKGTPPFLRTDPDNQVTDNLAHLIDYSWIM